MSKERLEEIEDLFEDISNDMMPPYVGITCDTVVDVKWVIKYAKEQVERVQELEEVLNIDAPSYQRVMEQNKRYREALEFYADEENYKPFDGILLSNYQNKVDEDGGEIARKALEESE